MSTVTFASGVYVGTRDDTLPFLQWFGYVDENDPGDAVPVTQFTTVTLALADLQVLTSVEGRAGDSEPVLLRFAGGGLPGAYDKLKAIDCRDLLGGQPRTGLSGWRDAVARSGYLVKMTLRLYGDSAAREEWGVLAGVRNTVSGGERGWGVNAVFHPCDALNWLGTGTWFLTPTKYDALIAEFEAG